MKLGAILINTSRGPIVDETALLEAVQSRRIIGAVDIYDREPLPASHPLRRAPNLEGVLPAEHRERARLPGRECREGDEPRSAPSQLKEEIRG